MRCYQALIAAGLAMMLSHDGVAETAPPAAARGHAGAAWPVVLACPSATDLDALRAPAPGTPRGCRVVTNLSADDTALVDKLSRSGNGNRNVQESRSAAGSVEMLVIMRKAKEKGAAK